MKRTFVLLSLLISLPAWSMVTRFVEMPESQLENYNFRVPSSLVALRNVKDVNIEYSKDGCSRVENYQDYNLITKIISTLS